MSNNRLLMMTLVILFLFVACVPSHYTPCSKWEIFSNENKRFMMRVCDSKLGYGFQDLSRKDKKTISKEVYSKLTMLLSTQDTLRDCRIDLGSINYLYGTPRHNLNALVVCKNKISFEQEDGRYYTIFYH